MSEHVREDTTASIPKDLVNEIEPFLSKFGYKSVSEFVRDAVRRRLEELGEKGKEQREALS